ncbi:MAG: hypothetical protein PHF86_07720 [Candidatus Nanoarchaeia archaeon]|nr:hypothetical protein [Candidatus Nanoarchaeia archaeon]
MLFNKGLIRKFNKKFELNLRSLAIKGVNDIKLELLKRNQNAKITYVIKKNKIIFYIVPKLDILQGNDVSKKQKSVLNGLEEIPLELLSQELSEDFSFAGVEKAMLSIQEQAGRQIQDEISKLI